jgi:hypothetical protein
MPHLDPDTLALLSLGEAVATDADTAHLAECASCRDEIDALALAVHVGRNSLSSETLVAPDARVWAAISSELGLESRELGAKPRELGLESSELGLKSRELGAKPRRSRRPGRLLPLLVAAVTAVALVVGGAAVWQALRPAADRPAPDRLVASASLEPFPAWPTAAGSATLEQHPDGTRSVTVTLDAPPAEGGFREAWLITSDASALVSLGVLRETTGTFDVPEGVDTAQFDLVDVSAEADDGDAAHSGDSIVRGRLESATIEG